MSDVSIVIIAVVLSHLPAAVMWWDENERLWHEQQLKRLMEKRR